SLKDAEFLKQLLLEIASGWKESGGKVTLAQDMEAKLDAHFRQSLQDAAKNGLKVEFSPQMKSGFALSPADGSYKLSFSDEDFINLFKSFLRPRSNQILFQD
ncbi:MAG TPA: hypothetical protein PKH19_05695, partial [Candidatus Syntrophosphaera sp.]|nr:hypothetical protein [Candidatus Syntrophosphaera sp.]